MEQNEIPPFNKNQVFTLIGFLIVIIACTFYKRNVGLISFAVGILLILIKAADEKVVFKAISWSTLLMITGFGMLMDIVILVGGVSLLSDSLAKIMTPHTAVAIQGLTGGIMSWFSSDIGVVSPASTGGGLIMAANATDPDFTKEKENKLFIKLFAISVLMVVLIVIAALFGLYSIL